MTRESSAPSSRQKAETPNLDSRALTRLRVLNCIRDAGEASRTNIAAALRLSPATVTFVTSGLMSGDLIEEVTGDAPEGGRRGRPRVSLRLKRGGYHVAGIKVTRESLSILVLDFDGSELAQSTVPLASPCMEPQELVEAIRDGVEATCRDLDGGTGSLAGISIGLAGQVDPDTRFVHWSSSLLHRNADLGPLLDAHLPCPAFVENDANLVAKAEQLFGEARGLNNFLVVTIEHGVGLGIVLDGALYRGERGCGAEFGHTKVELDGPPCQCGQKGCLEAFVGSYALLNAASPCLNGAAKTVQSIVDSAKGGNQKAQAILDRAGQYFGMGLSNLINLFDPERIILAGAPAHFEYLHTDKVLDRVRSGVVKVDAPLPDIRVHQWGDLMWARGAAAMGIEKVSQLKVRELGKNAS